MCLLPGWGIAERNSHNRDFPDSAYYFYGLNIGIAVSNICFGNKVNSAGTAGLSAGFKVNLIFSIRKLDRARHSSCPPHVLEGWLLIDSKLDFGVQFDLAVGFTGIQGSVAIDIFEDAICGSSLKLNPNPVFGFYCRIFCRFKIVIQPGNLIADDRPFGPIHETGQGVNKQDNRNDDAGDDFSDGQWLFFFVHVRDVGFGV